MKIGFYADLHYDDFYSPLSHAQAVMLVDTMPDLDAVVLCGDNAEYSPDFLRHKRLFGLIRNRTDKPVAFIAGNHDLDLGTRIKWRVPTPSPQKILFEVMPKLADEFDLTYLEQLNLTIDDFTIAGSYGHYDATLANNKDRRNYTRATNNDTNLAIVSDLMDGLETRTHRTDPDRLIMVTHTVPNLRLIANPDAAINKAYLPIVGSVKINRLLHRRNPFLYFCGHTHQNAFYKENGRHRINIGNSWERSDTWYFIFNTNDRSITVKHMQKPQGGPD